MRGCVCVYVCLYVCMRGGAYATLVAYATHETYETRLFFPSQNQISAFCFFGLPGLNL
jgi:hypothetical protein